MDAGNLLIGVIMAVIVVQGFRLALLENRIEKLEKER